MRATTTFPNKKNKENKIIKMFEPIANYWAQVPAGCSLIWEFRLKPGAAQQNQPDNLSIFFHLGTWENFELD